MNYHGEKKIMVWHISHNSNGNVDMATWEILWYQNRAMPDSVYQCVKLAHTETWQKMADFYPIHFLQKNHHVWLKLHWASWGASWQHVRSSLLQIMACHLFGTKPLSQAMLTYCTLNSLDQISEIFESKQSNLNSSKLVWKWCQPIDGYFVSTTMCWQHS